MILIWFLLFPLLLFSIEPNLVVYGPPGSGKGTFSQHLKQKYSYQHVSSGDLIRYEIDHQTPIGKEVEETVRKGDFIRQEIIHDLMRKKVIEFLQIGRPFIIDGFARSEESLLFLQNLFQELHLQDQILLVYLEADDETCASRILSRLICRECGYVYNSISCRPIQEGVCDLCQAPLKKRLNDDRSVILKRLAEYRNFMENIIDGAKKNYPFVRFNTEEPLPNCLKKYDLFVETYSNNCQS